MKKELMITVNGIKKKKVNTIIILLLISFAVMLIYIALNSLIYTNKLSKSLIEKSNASDFVFLVNGEHEEEIKEKVLKIDGVTEYEAEEAIIFSSTLLKTDNYSEEMMALFFNYDEERTHDIPNIVDTKGEFTDDSIILPYYLHTVKGVKSGEKISVESASGSYEFTVYGFLQDVYFSNPSNMTLYKVYVNNANFLQLCEKSEEPGSVIAKTTMNSVMIDGDPNKITNGIVDSLGNDIELQFIIEGKEMASVSFIYVDVLAAIIFLFAIIIITVILVVIRFSIISHIDSNMKNLGTLSAVGYTSNQLRLSSALEFALITLVGGIVGIASSLLFSGFVGDELSKACGLKWQLSFNPAIALITYVCVFVFVVSISYISTRKFKKITPLVALRNGIETHNYKKNRLPLSKTKLGLNASLGVKNIFSNGRQSLLILFIVILLSFTCLVTITFSNNFSSRSTTLTKIVGMERSDIQVYVMKEKNDTAFEKIAQMEDVEKTIVQKAAAVKIDSGGEEITVTNTSFSDYDNLEVNTIYKGRYPKANNEVAITYIVAAKLNVGIGDVINVKGNVGKMSFYVTGITQQMNNMGLGIRTTTEGFNQVNSVEGCLLVYLKDGVKNSDFIALGRKQFQNQGVEFYDVDEVFKNVTGFIKDIFNTISIILAVTTYIVIALITFLIIKMKLLKDKKMIGIYKAIGYTTGQIIIQTIISLLPLIILGSVIGVVISQLTCNKIFALCLSSFGVKQINLDMFIEYAIFGILIMVALSLAIALLCSARVKKIEPYTMIIEV